MRAKARARSFPVPVSVRSDNNKDGENGGRLIYSRRNVKPAFNCPLTGGTKCRFHGRPRGNALNDVPRSLARSRELRVLYLRPRFSSTSRHSFSRCISAAIAVREEAVLCFAIGRPIKPADFNARGRRTSAEADACARAGRKGNARIRLSADSRSSPRFPPRGGKDEGIPGAGEARGDRRGSTWEEENRGRPLIDERIDEKSVLAWARGRRGRVEGVARGERGPI